MINSKRILLIFSLVFISFLSTKAQEITVFPGFGTSGFYQDKYPITKAQFESLIAQNKVANAYWQKSKKQRTISFVALGAELGFVAWEFVVVNRTLDYEIVPIIGAVGSVIVSIGYSLSSAKFLRMTVLEYNEGLDHPTTLNLGITGNGVGVVMRF